MTGYGAAEGKVGSGAVFVEVRCVNHRYCDVTLKIPPKLHVLDQKFRQVIGRHIVRGKVELFLKERHELEPTPRVVLNVPLAKAYERTLRTFEKQFGGARHELLSIVPFTELVRIEEQSVRYEKLWPQVQRICRQALAALDQMRREEGAHLHKDQQQRLQKIESFRTKIAERARDNHAAVRTRFQSTKNSGGAEMGRSQHEAMSAAMERIDIAEELTRLQSHLIQYRRFMARKGAVGRQLDFLIQEMNREINTIGSKSGDARISQLVVEAKSELEKVREQAQNIE